MRVTVSPGSTLVDEVPVISVTEGPPDEAVELTIEVVDAAGHRWRSTSQLGGPDGERRWWDMEFIDENAAPTAFSAPPDELLYTITATAGGEVATTTATRQWLRTGVTEHSVDGDGFRLTIYTPAEPVVGDVLVVPGSTGAAAMKPLAALLASRGYRSAVAAYMQDPGLPTSLVAIPIEVIAAAFRAFSERETVVLSASVGTGGVLSALAHILDIDPVGVVAIAPTSVVWQALGEGGPPPNASMWSLAGSPLLWVPSHGERVLGQILRHAVLDRFARHPVPHALRLHDAYAKGLSDSTAVAAAAIPVENIRCPLLLLSGTADDMWPSGQMANAIMSRRQRSDDVHMSFENAGHFLRPPVTPTTVPWNDALVSGGTPEGNAQAQSMGWKAILGFLDHRFSRISPEHIDDAQPRSRTTP